MLFPSLLSQQLQPERHLGLCSSFIYIGIYINARLVAHQIALMYFEIINADFLVPELVEGCTAKLSLHAASSRAKRAAGKWEVAFFSPVDKLRNQVRSVCI